MSFFPQAFAIVVGEEGGYVNDPKDPGLSALAQSLMQRFVILPSALRVLLQSLARWHAHVVLPIVHLLFVRCPATISRFVMPVYIFTVQSFSWRTFPHVSQKVLKAIQPACTHADTSGAVNRIFRIGLGVATALSMLPCAILASIRRAMRQTSSARCFFADAATTEGAARSQILSNRDDGVPAFALTVPGESPSVKMARFGKYGQTSKFLAYQRDFSHAVVCHTLAVT